MRHAVFGQKLSRDINARKALINNLASSLLENNEITTTLAKAKFAQKHVEKMITVAKKNKLERNRILSQALSNKAFAKLISEIGPGFSQRNGGYTKIIKLERRIGDAAMMAKISLLKYEKTHEKTKTKVTKPRVKNVSSKKAKAVKKQANKI